MIRVCHVAPLASGYIGGPLISIPGLCQALLSAGVDATLLCLDLPEESSRNVRVRNFRRWGSPIWKELSISPTLRKATHEAARGADVIHVHGMWQMPCIYPARAVKRTECRLLASPRGSLSKAAFAHSRRRKWILWWIAQRRLFERADCIHATSNAEAEDIRRIGLTAPIAVIPNGVHITQLPARIEHPTRRCILYMGRLHAIKGLDLLMRAWSAAQDRATDTELLICGDGGRDDRRQLEASVRELGLRRVKFQPAVTGAAKHAVLAEASVVVLPSHSENFGMVVAEALSAGIPVVASMGTPWKGLIEHGCGWWLGRDVESWAEALVSAATMPERDLREMGDRGRRWMDSEFSWSHVAEMMSVTYLWVLGQAPRPVWVFE